MITVIYKDRSRSAKTINELIKVVASDLVRNAESLDIDDVEALLDGTMPLDLISKEEFVTWVDCQVDKLEDNCGGYRCLA